MLIKDLDLNKIEAFLKETWSEANWEKIDPPIKPCDCKDGATCEICLGEAVFSCQIGSKPGLYELQVYVSANEVEYDNAYKDHVYMSICLLSDSWDEVEIVALPEWEEQDIKITIQKVLDEEFESIKHKMLALVHAKALFGDK